MTRNPMDDAACLPLVRGTAVQRDDLKALLAKLHEAATKWPRCCDLWQDGLGGMHCRDCSQKTFAMMRDVQSILGVDKSGKPAEPGDKK